MQFSVLIIVKKRHDHLLRVLEGIALSSQPPTEIIVVHMNENAALLQTSLPVQQITIHSEHVLPLAMARNCAARAATTDQLIFLDVDCIPAPDCFARLLDDLKVSDLVMADPYYLTEPVNKVDYDLFTAQAHINKARQLLQLGDSNKYELFWSLGFAITKPNFMRIDGFDELFVGYGGEDTDFAFRARKAGIRLRYSTARVYHQNHPSYDPPLNWLADIVANAQRFKAVWGTWPMDGWLGKFAAYGYIDWSEDSISIKKLPSEAEIEAARKLDAL